MNVITNPDTITRMAEAVTRADAQGRKFSLFFNDNHDTVIWKVGESMWTPPYPVD